MKVNEAKTAGEIFDLALQVTTKEHAEAFINEYAEDWFQNNNAEGRTLEQIKTICRQNLGFFAGYYSDETRAKIEDLFSTEHPIFGKISKHKPTPEEAFNAGLKMGEAARKEGAK